MGSELCLRDRSTSIISGNDLSNLFESEAVKSKRIESKKKVLGELVGGNLSVISNMLGTKCIFNFKEKILLLEDVGEAPHKVYRNIQHLEHAGVFDQISGLVLGEFARCAHPKGLGPTTEEIFRKCFENKQYPVYCTSSFGHGDINQSFPLFRRAELSADGLTLC